MNTILRKSFRPSLIPLCLVLIILFIAACDKKEYGEPEITHEETPLPYGNWEVKAISFSDKLNNIDSMPNDASHSNISITILDTTQGSISGNTFMNTIWIGYEIQENHEILIKSYAGTRVSEDPWGMAFKHHIMFNVVKFNIINNELQFIDSLDNPVIVFINH